MHHLLVNLLGKNLPGAAGQHARNEWSTWREWVVKMRKNIHKHKKRLLTRILEPLVQPLHPNLTWSMDFMHDGLLGGKPFRSFNIIDDYNREVLNITIDTSMTSLRIIRELDRLIEWRGKPIKLRCDNGPEYISQAMEDWALANKIELNFIQPGKPHQNGYVERFNRTYREEILDNYAFETLTQARTMTNAWMWVYNNERHHSSLGYLPPRGFLLKHVDRLALTQDLEEAFPTFQRDEINTWKTLFLTATV